jgi:thiamine-phosphate diphosphorylase
MGSAPDARRKLDLFAVTPGRGDLEELLEALPRLVARGATKLLLREKTLAPARRRQLAGVLVPACRERGLEPWISEDVELALAVGAAGVHLSERSPSPLAVRARLPPEMGVGVSLHRPIARSREELLACRHAFLGPVFATPGKPDAAPLSIDGFLNLAADLPLPVYPIGGIGESELEQLAVASVRRAAAVRLFFPPRDERAP